MKYMYLQFSTDLGVTANYWISSLLLHRKPLNLFWKVMNTNYLIKLNEIKTHSEQQVAQPYIDKFLVTDS